MTAIEEIYKEYVRKEVDKYPWITPSALALKSFYVLGKVGKFTELRAVAEQTKQIYLTKLPQHDRTGKDTGTFEAEV